MPERSRRFRGLAAGTQHGSGSSELPRLTDEAREDFVGDFGKFDADPAFNADIGWFEIDFGSVGDHCGLGTVWSGNPDSGMAVAVVVVGEHDEGSLGHKECGLAVRELFGGTDVGKCQSSNSVDLGFCG